MFNCEPLVVRESSLPINQQTTPIGFVLKNSISFTRHSGGLRLLGPYCSRILETSQYKRRQSQGFLYHIWILRVLLQPFVVISRNVLKACKLQLNVEVERKFRALLFIKSLESTFQSGSTFQKQFSVTVLNGCKIYLLSTLLPAGC